MASPQLAVPRASSTTRWIEPRPRAGRAGGGTPTATRPAAALGRVLRSSRTRGASALPSASRRCHGCPGRSSRSRLSRRAGASRSRRRSRDASDRRAYRPRRSAHGLRPSRVSFLGEVNRASARTVLFGLRGYEVAAPVLGLLRRARSLTSGRRQEGLAPGPDAPKRRSRRQASRRSHVTNAAGLAARTFEGGGPRPARGRHLGGALVRGNAPEAK